MKIEEEIKQKQFGSPQEKAVVNLMYTYNWLKDRRSVFLKEYDLSNQQFNVLRILRGQYPNPASVKLIIERMLDKSSNASRLVDKLLAKGLVDRTSCPNDRRQVDVVINQKGLDLIQKASESGAKQLEKLGISAKESELLSDLLDKLRKI
ncbi:MAG: MarR family transcriptional regulator [Flavobacteriales bacterium]|nr:MarR family transcriptional regulator [Flavobacteriales bacterium]